jgi:serine protease Do
MKTLQASILGALIVAGIAAAPNLAHAQAQPPARVATPSIPGASAQVLPDFADLVEKYGPAVVNIGTQTRAAARPQFPGASEDDPFYEFFRRFLPPDGRAPDGRNTPPQTPNPRGNRNRDPDATPRGPLRPFGLGSGFIVSPDGFIVTNAHVVENADEINVRLTDKREFKAKVIGVDTRSDVAVIKIDATSLPTVKIGDMSKLRVGEWVIAIGSPFGFANTVTAGIVSAKSRDNLSQDQNTDAVPFIQTDVAVNPGNSGGPLLNMKGEVVGINTAIRGGGAQGIGFAIPINMVKQLLPMLMRDGHVTRSALGIRIRDVRELSPDDRAALKLVDDKGTPLVQTGAVVEFVSPGGPADRAGLNPGDVILAFEGQTIERGTQLQWLSSTFGVGKQASVRVAREGKRFDIKVTLGQLPDPPMKQQRGALPPGFGPPPH